MPQFPGHRPLFTLRVIGFTFAHFVVQLGVFVVAFSVGMRTFETMEPVGPLETVLNGVSNLLMLPLALPLVRWWPFGTPPGFLFQHLPFLLNSLLWGVSLAYLWPWKQGTHHGSFHPPAA